MQSRHALVGIVTLVLVAAAPTALAGGAHHHDDHVDPGVSASFALFPQHDDVLGRLRAHADHPWFTLHDVGASEEGKPILLAEVTNPDSSVPMDERVVTFLFTQQHGNEPAGTPAALDLLDDVAAGGDAARALDNQVLLVLPMANPDGAAANQRANARDVDINRDHVGLETHEARAVHDVLNRWDVHVALDHHEYGGTGPGVPGVVTLYDADLTTLFAVHGNVRDPARQAAEHLMYDGIWPAAREAGFTVNEYGRMEVAGEVEVQRVAGGPDPGIMRNHLGLHHVAGLLIETRVDALPNPVQDAARRVAIHDTVMRATLAFVSEHAEEFVDAKRASAAAELDEPAADYVEGDARGALADAYRVKSDVDATFIAHGLPASVDGFVHDLRHAQRGHAAAIVHPASSRAIVDAAAVDAPDALALAAEEGAAPVPAAGVGLVAAIIVGAAASRRRT